MKLVYLRRFVQMVVLAAIVVPALFSTALAHDYLPWLSRFSPLMTIVTRIAQQHWTPFFCGGLLTALLCLAWPRVFCGWLCPLGCAIDLVDRITFANKVKSRLAGFWLLAIIILVVMIVLAFAGYETAGYVDPLTITGNTVESLSQKGFIEQVKSQLRTGEFDRLTIMPAIALVILTLAVFGRRTWCRLLCPLGGMLGLLATVSLRKRFVDESCVSCGKCAKECKMCAIGSDVKETTENLCVVCHACSAVCPKKSITF